MRRILIALLFTVFCAAAVTAADIKGKVIDETGEPLIEATVKLLAAKDSAFIKGVTTNVNGRFTISNVKSGKYILQCVYIGYANSDSNLTVGSSNLQLKDIVMRESSIMLKEAVVTAVKTEITVKEDTIEYNAGSYKTQPNAVMEDLLKKLPGVDVDSDGKITAGGKSVTKILVDGKEFFADDPKVASKNLPVDMIEKLQVIDRKSDLARLTGVDDGEEETVINLTVKKDMKNSYYGVVNAGYGTDDRYAGNFYINRLWNDNQFTFIGNFNNVNQLGFTDGGGQFMNFGGGNGITTSQSLGVNFNVGKSDETFRVGGNVDYSHTDRDTRTRRNRQYLFPDSTSFNESASSTRNKGHNIRGNFRIKWEKDTLTTFEFRPRFSLNYNRYLSGDSSLTLAGDANRSKVTRSLNSGSSKGTSYSAGGDIWFNRKSGSHPGRSFSLSLNYNLSNTTEDYDSYSFNRFFLLNDSIDLYDQYTDNHTWSNRVGLRATWTEPLGNIKNARFLIFSYNLNYRWNNADKLVYDHPVTYPEVGDPIIDYDNLVFNDSLSTRFRNDFFTQRIQIGFRQVRSTYNMEVGLTLTPSMSRSDDLINSERNIPTRWVWNLAPYMRYRHKFTKSRTLNVDYRGNTSEPSMQQLQPVADKSNPLRIVIGNPDLKPAFTHNIRIRFNDFNMEAQRSIMAMLNFSMRQNSIVSKTTFSPETGGQVTTYTNVNGNWSSSLFSMLSLPFRNKNWQFNANMHASYNQNIGFNNGLRNRSNSLNLRPSIAIAFRPEAWEFELRPYYGLQNTRNTLQSAVNRNVQDYGGSFYAVWYAPFGLVINSDLTFSTTSGYSAGYDQKQWMWNASISYLFLKGREATVMLRGYDLLQQRKNISRSVTANYIDDSSYNSLTRYFMLSFSYRFNTFGKGSKNSNRGEFGGPGGFGGPGHGGGRPSGGGGRPPRR